MRIEITPRSGQFAGKRVFSNRGGEGIFSQPQGSGGAIVQHTGTGQTPRFRSTRQLAAWVRRHYPEF